MFSPLTGIMAEATDIELLIPWPVTLPDGAKLQLALKGKPVWEHSAVYAIRVRTYEFRTRANRRQAEPISEPVGVPDSVRAYRYAEAAGRVLAMRM